MWNNQKQQKSCFPLCQTYKPTILTKEIPWDPIGLFEVNICAGSDIVLSDI